MSSFNLQDLAAIILERTGSTADKSYTKSLLDAGKHRVAKKFGEEAVELALATVDGSDADVKAEAADVLYHLLVLLRARGISVTDVLNELETRTQQSGHQEKASRTSGG
ncbi:MAG: phosphoribosyl-ATP diphosphatase [Rhizobiales bacterium 62-17]|nr:phosphoribosyl-ATP diphosphatase [Hyphomicrobiales bacterium]OJX99970.1 MAG: phosphoribosyl-ATP diphosphatase [Rhizobiales bacterium 62-17]